MVEHPVKVIYTRWCNRRTQNNWIRLDKSVTFEAALSPMTIRQKNHDQTHLFLYLWQQRTKGIEWLTFIFALQKQLVSQH